MVAEAVLLSPERFPAASSARTTYQTVVAPARPESAQKLVVAVPTWVNVVPSGLHSTR